MTSNVIGPLIPFNPLLIVSRSPAKSEGSYIYSEAEIRHCVSTLLQTVKSNATEAADNSRHTSSSRNFLLVVRTHTGEGELHKLLADEVINRIGEGTMALGGTITNIYESAGAEGEFHCKTIIDAGKEIPLRPESELNIAASVPRCLRLSPNGVYPRRFQREVNPRLNCESSTFVSRHMQVSRAKPLAGRNDQSTAL